MSHQDNEKNKRLRETIKSLPPMTRDTAERARERSCFYCSNTHNFTEEKCECACHKVAPTWDALEAIEKDLGWTIPQLIAIQKLETTARRDGIRDAEAAFKEAYSEYEEPLIGVMYGMKAIAALAQALQLEEKEEDRGQD